MAHITQLPPHVADLIAAGEVVERPASVVKELMENAIDAHADTITVEIHHGGMTLIRVTDTGDGITAGELPTAFLRHATSKIRDEHDLEAIGTLGFRGEALAAIAAVSRIEIMSCPEGVAMGASLTLEGGDPGKLERVGCPKGTTIVVRDLFFNTPARLKFMKRDAAEGAAVLAVVQRIALSHPEIKVKFIRDGKQELLTPGDGKLQSAMYAVLGRNIALGFTKVVGSGEDVAVRGYCSIPACCRTTRATQFFYVNGRHVRSRIMTAALEEAYRNRKMVGKFPGCVLFLEVRLTAVDVNVHPAKTEVKFGNERRIFDAVYYAVMGALDGENSRPSVLSDAGAAPTAPAKEAGAFAPKEPPTPDSLVFSEPKGAERTEETRRPETLLERTARRTTLPIRDAVQPGKFEPGPGSPYAAAVHREETEAEKVGPASAIQEVTPEAARPAEAVRAPQQELPPLLPEDAEAAQPWRVVGEAFNTYILVEQGDTLLLIDKHAAHERMNFDRMKAEGYTPMVQQLLTPLVFTPPAEEGAALLEQQELLRRFGFEVEPFGDGALLVRQAPFDVDADDVEGVLCELGGKLAEGGRPDPDGARDALLHSMSCKAAIKGGQKNGEAELYRVAREVINGTVKYCPHGRPVATELTKAQLEKRFKRT
ncbi:MAG: DNA mismatch repair endonuclease MutL [Oscillospiraceae bacterium]|nr:DNA mismatch repair endonuclease MutL [Oscillospiraceae bacterium]